MTRVQGHGGELDRVETYRDPRARALLRETGARQEHAQHVTGEGAILVGPEAGYEVERPVADRI